MKKQFLAVFLALAMLVSVLPVSAMAEEGDTAVEPCAVTEGCILADGHEGDCVTAPAEPEDGEDDPNSDNEFEDGIDDDAGVISQIQARIDALPDANALVEMDIEEQAEVYAEVCAIYDAIDELSDEEVAGLDMDALEEAAAFFTRQIMPLDGETTDERSGDCGATDEDKVTWALTQNSDGSTYTLTISGSGAMADYKDPQGKNVTDEEKAPWYTALTADATTHMVPITKIVVGDEITGLGDYAFAYTSVEEAEFKANVKDYGDALYYSCQNLTTVNWDNFYPENISDGWVTEREQAGTYVPFSLFDGCKSLATCTIGGTTYNQGVLVLPEYISVVCTAAFRGTGFDKIDFSDGLKNITAAGPYAFAQTSITEITLPDNVEFYHQNDNAAANTFNKCNSLESVTIRSSGTTIVSGMFSNCSALETVNGSDNIDVIETSAFQYCSALESFSSNSVQKIDSMAFLESGLKSLSLGKIGEIGTSAFLGCDELTTVSIVGKPSLTIPSNAFSFWQSTSTQQYSPAAPLESFTLENGTLPAFTAKAKETLTSLKLGDGVTFVPDGLCNGFSKLENVELGAGITRIGSNAFKGTKITSIAIPDSVTEIGNNAFTNCGELKTVTISADSQLTTIGKYAFQSTGISSIYIPQNVTKLGEGAFNNCYSMTAVDMTAISSISSITFDKWAFSWSKPSEGEDLRGPRVFYVSPDDSNLDKIKDTNNGFNAYYDTLAVTNGGTFIERPTFTDEKFDKPAKSGQAFEGWYKKSDFSGDTVDAPEKQGWGGYGQTYYAKWKNSSYNINQSYIAFSSMTYGAISGSNTITVSGSGGSGSTSAASSDENIFTVSVTENTITVTPVSTLDAGDYSETITVTAPDGATFSVPVTLVVTKADSTVTPGDENNSNITATYGDTITLTAKTQREAETGIALMTALDEVDFVYGNIVLGSAPVTYDENGVGTATLRYNTSNGDIPVNQKAYITAEYGGNGNLYTGTGTNIIVVTLSPKPLTITGLTATDRAYDGTTAVALTGGTLNGIIGNDKVSAAMPTSGTVASADVGTGKAVTFSNITLSGADAGKYTLTQQPTVTVNITKAKYDMSTVTFADVSYPYDGTEKKLEISGKLPGGVTVSYTNNTLTNVGMTTATASFISDPANYEAIADMTATLTITAAASGVTITPSATSLTGGGTVKLTVTGLPDGVSAAPTCDGVTITANTDGTYSATLPNETKDYTFTVSYAGDANHEAATATCTVSVTSKSGSSEDTKVEVSGLNAVPEGLSAQYKSVDELTTALKTEITQINSAVPASNIAVYDVKLMVTTDGGATWEVATKDNFPANGKLTITLPYPSGTNSRYTFTVVHMFTTGDFGKTPGATEKPDVTNTANGIQFTVTGLSPISVGWTAPKSTGSGGGTSTPTYTVTVDSAKNGTVKANRTSASKGATVTLTVTPKDGYELDDLTVTAKNGDTVKLTRKSDTKYTFLMPASRVTVSASFAEIEPEITVPAGVYIPVSVANLPFTDVPEYAWYANAVLYVCRNDLMNGISTYRFAPEAVTSRGMIVTILYRLEGEPAVGASAFTDVAPGAWYARAAAWAAANGIVNGYGDGTFGPNDDITREQLAAILYRYAAYRNCDVSARTGLYGYADANQVSGYAADAMSWANAAGLITGVTADTLVPQGHATRAEVAVILTRFCENFVK